LEAVQQEVGEYLGQEALTGGDFDFDTIGPKVEPALREAGGACRALRAALADAGVSVAFADACGF